MLTLLQLVYHVAANAGVAGYGLHLPYHWHWQPSLCNRKQGRQQSQDAKQGTGLTGALLAKGEVSELDSAAGGMCRRVAGHGEHFHQRARCHATCWHRLLLPGNLL